MILKVLGSGSKGNCYILENEKEALIIEAGVPFKEVLKAINYDFDKIVGVIISHAHQDHSKYLSEYVKRGVKVLVCVCKDVYVCKDVCVCKNKPQYNITYICKNNFEQLYKFGCFSIIPFENVHDMPCYGFYIKHEEIGRLVFATDTAYIKYNFNGVNIWIIECNYDPQALNENVKAGVIPESLANRVVASHMGLDDLKEFFKCNDISKTNSVILAHLSENNSNREKMVNGIAAITNKPVFVANKGLELDISLIPF